MSDWQGNPLDAESDGRVIALGDAARLEDVLEKIAKLLEKAEQAGSQSMSMQGQASVTTGMWYARSDFFLQQGFLETLRWVRTFGDVVFMVGAIAIAWQVVILGLWRKGARV